MGLDHGLIISIKDSEPIKIVWRKRNHFHAWFADNASKFEDNAEFEVLIEELDEFVNTCKRIIDDNTLSESQMPTRNGFFFGGTEYDEWYYDSLRDTIEQLDNIDFSKIELITYWSWW